MFVVVDRLVVDRPRPSNFGPLSSRPALKSPIHPPPLPEPPPGRSTPPSHMDRNTICLSCFSAMCLHMLLCILCCKSCILCLRSIPSPTLPAAYSSNPSDTSGCFSSCDKVRRCASFLCNEDNNKSHQTMHKKKNEKKATHCRQSLRVLLGFSPAAS